MENILGLKSTALGRTVLLCVLLNGLLFSCGEGIRLFPFPASKVTVQPNFETRFNGEKDYEKNLHRFENRSPAYQAKNQQNKDNHWLSSSNSVKNPLSEAPVNSSPTGLLFQSNLVRSRYFKQQTGSRAPPLS